jgi:hypothetical protein
MALPRGVGVVNAQIVAVEIEHADDLAAARDRHDDPLREPASHAMRPGNRSTSGTISVRAAAAPHTPGPSDPHTGDLALNGPSTSSPPRRT